MRIFLLNLTLVFSQLSIASICGTATDFSTDHDGYITGFTVEGDNTKLRITPKNSPTLHKFLRVDQGYFVCLDKFETYTRKVRNNDEIRTYAKTSEWRLWFKGEFLTSLPLKDIAKEKLLIEASEELGEYIGDLHFLSKFQSRVLTNQELSKKLRTLGAKILKNQNEQLGERGSIAGISYREVRMRKTQEVIGYVISTDEIIYNNSLHDGSGVHFYIDPNFEIQFKVNWAG